MMVYRLSRKQYSNDLSGKGAEISGGRWNNKGVFALYTASSRALAVLEVAVHVPYGIMPIDYWMITIEIPEEHILRLSIADLPKNWNQNPTIPATRDFGDRLLNKNEYLSLQMPSASVAGDYNYIVNPLHPEFSRVKILFTEPFEFDSRLFKS